MRHIITRALKTDLVKISFSNGMANVLKLLAAVIGNRIVALYLGPVGIALLGQFLNVGLIATALATLGIGNGITKYAAEYRADDEKRARLISTGLFLGSIATGIVSLVLWRGRFYFAVSVFKEPSFASVFSLFGASMMFFTLQAFSVALLAGNKEFKKAIGINIISSFLGLIISVILIRRFLLLGAIWGVMVSQVIVSLVSLGWMVKSSWWSWRACVSGIDSVIIKNLGKFSLMTFTNTFATAFVQLRIRSHIMDSISVQEAGYWQGIVKLSDVYVMFIIATLGIYYLPRLSEIRDNDELRREVRNVFLFVMPLTVVSSAVIYWGRDLVVSWLFADSFAPMKELFLFQLTGNIFRVGGWLLTYVLIARAMTTMFVVSELCCGGLLYGATLQMVNKYGVIGATYAYAVTHVLYFVAQVILFRIISRGQGTQAADEDVLGQIPEQGI